MRRPAHTKPNAPATAAARGPLVDLKSAPVENPAKVQDSGEYRELQRLGESPHKAAKQLPAA